MARLIEITPSKTYKTEANMLKAIAGIPDFFDGRIVRYLTLRTEDGRFYPVFVGAHLAHLAQHGFCVVS